MRKFELPQGRGARLFVVNALVASALIGCGGGGGHHAKAAPKGGLRLSVAWPASQSRVIPANAHSIVVQIKQGSTLVDSGTIVRPASAASFAQLPVGTVNVTATAFASTDGTGIPLATASVPATIVANQTSNVDVTLASTIDRLTVAPNPFVLGAGFTSQINVVAYDANNAVVLLDPSSLSFSSSNPGLATVDASGNVSASLGLGSATITINEADSGKTLSLPFSVVPGVTISGGAGSLTLRGTTTFTASVAGTANQAVNWSVLEGAAGGTITAGGLYTAPATKGVFHIVGTSAADPNGKGTATIVVTSGGANVVVH